MNYKPFNLEAAKRGEPIICRCGTRPTEIHLFTVPDKDYPLLVAHEDGRILPHGITGAYDKDTESHNLDLFMAPVKRKVWLNIDRAGNMFGYNSKEGADRNSSICRIACIEIEYEEGQGL